MKKTTIFLLLTFVLIQSSSLIFAQGLSDPSVDTDNILQLQKLQTEHGPTIVVAPSGAGLINTGDNCTNPITVTGALPISYNDIGQTTCGRGNDYDNTGMGYYDGGEDIIYKVVLAEEAILTVTLDPLGTTWSGIGIFDACPDVGSYLGGNNESSSSIKSVSKIVPAGTYYIMIDTWPSPDCIPNFNLNITTETLPPPISSYPFLETFTEAFTPITCTNNSPDLWRFGGTAYYGADVDHTTGTIGGYAWVDDSYPDTNPSDLDTYIFDITSLTFPTLNFWYWIGDNNPGSTLEIDIFNGTSWQTGVATLNPNFEWGECEIDLAPYQSAGTKIRFRGIENTTGFNCDICIDDVKVYNNIPPVSSYPYLETFAGAMPSFWANSSPDFWKFGGTATFGADVDHTTGAIGGYAWVDDSAPYANPHNLETNRLDIATLSYPTLNFWYWIGKNNNLGSTLDIDIFDGENWHTSVITLNPNSKWSECEIDLAPYQSAETIVRFRGIENTAGDNCDICLDDVNVYDNNSGSSPTPVPVSNWVIVFVFVFIASLIAIRFKRNIA